VSKDRILPKGYYKITDDKVELKQGLYQGLVFTIFDKVKLRKDVLTDIPQLCYDYKILDYSTYDKVEVETSVILSRIIAAIIVEQYNSVLPDCDFEGVPCRTD